MSNMLINSDKFDLGDRDDFLRYKLEKVLYKIPRNERVQLFTHCRTMIAEQREARIAAEAV